MVMKRILTIILACLMLIGIAACSTKATSSASATTSTTGATTAATTTQAQQDAKKFAIVFPIVHPFFEPIAADADNHAKEMGWEVITKAPDSPSAQLQIEIMENLIAMKVDGIAIGPTDPTALVPVIDKAVAAGIKVICFAADAPTSKRHAYMGTDDYKAGRQMGEVIAKNLNGKGKIMILTGLPTQSALNERIRGINEYLNAKFPDIKVIDTQSSEGDAQKAVTATENMIQAYPDFDAIIGIDATAGPAAISVWKAKGWKSDADHMIITFDDMPDNLQGLRDGFITALVAQRQSTWGKATLDMLNDLCVGKTVPASTDTGSIEITMKNIDTYTSEASWVEQQ